jgi:hypothetical protein
VTEPDERIEAVVSALISGTANGKVSWSATSREDAYIYTGANSGVIIRQYWDDDGDRATALDLLDGEGRDVETFYGDWETGGAVARPGPFHKRLRSLYDSARRNALNIDGVIDALLTDLDGSS